MNSEYQPMASGNKRGSSIRWIVILVLLAFVGGAIATGWAMTRMGNPFATEALVPTGTANNVGLSQKLAGPKTTGADGSADQALAIASDDPTREIALSARVKDLEDRLARINVQAQQAGGNAARAEGLLVAFAARRALDMGSDLGYIEGQLRLRFGEAQPKAVTTIVNASRDPVTLEMLASGLADIGPSLTTGSSSKGFLHDVRRELSELFVIRKDGTPSPAPQQRLARAERFIEAGNVEAALLEIEKLPGADKAQQWTEMARRYHEARRALDVIESAAILEPRELRGAEGEQVTEPSAIIADAPVLP
jgi:hypothetical protein